MGSKRVRAAWLATALLAASFGSILAAKAQSIPDETAVEVIDLTTVLRLARAQNVDVQLARAQLELARAEYRGTWSQFFPWLAIGTAVQRHEGRTQAVDGALLDVDKQNLTNGLTLGAQINFGDAVFNRLVAQQTAAASTEHLRASEDASVSAAAQAYFDLLKAKMLVEASRASLATSEDYGRQLQAAVDSGVAFKGDALRVRTQSDRYRLEVSQGEERQRLAAARLAQLLHLDPAVRLVPEESEIVPITLVSTQTLSTLVEQALATRPELRESQAQVSAARSSKNAAIYGSLIPSLTAQAFLGELGGGTGTSTGNRGDSEDYYLALRWRFGPGGLFDFGRIDASRARLSAAEIAALKVHDEIAREVVDGFTRAQALTEQIAASKQMLEVATQTLNLTRQRKQLGVGVVLEDIQAQQELHRARAEHLSLIAEFNKVQYSLSRSIGEL